MIRRRIFAALLAVIIITALSIPVSALGGGAAGSIAMGLTHGAAVGSNGTVYTWGENVNGQLGDGKATAQISPKAVMTNAVMVSVGYYHTLALMADGTLFAWGESVYGQLGTGIEVTQRSPVEIMKDVIFCSAGNYSSFAITSDNTLWAWGNNDNAMLGDNSRTRHLSPVKIMENVASVSSGTTHTLAVKTDGTLWSWGSNDYGQLGIGSRMLSTIPCKIMDDIADAWAGGQNSLALGTDGTLYSWGANTYGQIGDGTRIDRLLPVKILEDVVTATIGGGVMIIDPSGYLVSLPTTEGYLQCGHGLAVLTDGTLWSWGHNAYGQVGDGTRIDRLTPVKIMDDIVEVAAARYSSAALATDGTLYTWGYNASGQLGTGNTTMANTPTKILTGIGGSSAAEPDAVQSKQTVLVNGEVIAFDAYNISGNNYFKLRDLAMALRNTDKKFDVTFVSSEGIIGIAMGGTYVPVGGELTPGSGAAAYTLPSNHKVVIDGLSVSPAGYNIGGNNYYKLRDFMKLINIYVGFDAAANTVIIDTTKGYED